MSDIQQPYAGWRGNYGDFLDLTLDEAIEVVRTSLFQLQMAVIFNGLPTPECVQKDAEIVLCNQWVDKIERNQPIDA